MLCMVVARGPDRSEPEEGEALRGGLGYNGTLSDRESIALWPGSFGFI
jgi:hypothetical protein